MRALVVDLTNEKVAWAPIREDSTACYLGGRGLGARFIYDHQAPGVDAFSPENYLTLWTSPIMATGTISMVKLCGVTKSPATGTILMSLMGGEFGPGLRFAGCDGLVIRGQAQIPVYLLIQDGAAEIRPAQHLWGKTTRQTEALLRKELGLERMQVSSIGPAGENRVAFASLMHGGDAMGRGGFGAVMGSKNLKAIVASGRQRPEIYQPKRFRAALTRIGRVYKESPVVELFGSTGTTEHVDGLNLRKIYPTCNFRSSHFINHQQVNADILYRDHVTKRVACYTCPVRCRRDARILGGEHAGVETHGPEYETLWSFGGNCGNHSMDAILAANELCLEYGLDTISTGMVISFAMECFEEGLIGSEDSEDLALNFGNHQAMLGLIHRIALRQGLGNILASGTRQAAHVIGGAAKDFAIQVKGLELAGYDPRGAKGMALGYATSPRGGCHERGFLTGEVLGVPPIVDRYRYEGKAALVKTAQDDLAVKDALGLCVLSSFGTSMDNLAELFSAATGFNLNAEELIRAGERICNLSTNT